MELRRSGEREWVRALSEGAALLYARSDAGGALALYTRARATEDVARIIRQDGFTLFSHGDAEILSRALDVLPDEMRRTSATATGLRAMIDAARGRFEVAEPAYLSAIALASSDTNLRLRLVHQYALELVRLDRDCVSLVEPYAVDESIEARFRTPLLATLATGYLRAGRRNDALHAAERALKLMDGSVNDELRARVYQQAAYVERYAGSREKARAYATTAIDLALANNLYDLAARAYSVLYTIVRDTSDDAIESLAILERLNESARKAASAHARLFAQVATYEIEAERGDDSALDRLDRQMREDEAMLPTLRTSTVLMVEALRAAWNGDFAAAYEMVGGTARDQNTNEQQALRAAESALYAAAAGLHAQIETELNEAGAALERSHAGNKHVIKARLFMALAHLLQGHDSAAHRLISEAERSVSASMTRLRTFAHAVRTMYRVRLGQTDEHHFKSALERLRSEHFGGMARLLEALPLASEQSGYSALTPAEREVLQLLAKGASTKDVAARTGRSPHTVDTHIRSICRKLNCSGRREAVALASSRGWVEA
jgi:DNA-binding CsgD family transcriptional regulator/tetratricopeptide (TPR) repeat protein